MRGIYVDTADDIDQTVLAHAVRVARYLYPGAHLSAASAVLLAPTRDGRLYLSGRRSQRTRFRGLEIVQKTALGKPALGPAVIADSLGESRVDASSIRQRFLEAFRLRSEHAASIDPAMRESIADRLILKYASSRAASDAVWALARANEWYRKGEGADLLRPPARPRAILIVAWHGQPIGPLEHPGVVGCW